MTFRSFSSIVIGMTMLGFSLGLVVGVYIQWRTGARIWAYLAVPFMGLGSGLAAYGTLRNGKSRDSSQENHG